MDETISTRVDEARRGKLIRIIPKSMMQIDPKTGKVIKFNDYDLDFLVSEDGAPGSDNGGIVMSKVDIDQKKYNDSFVSDLSFVLPNVGLSPATLGRFMGGTEGKEINNDRERFSIKTRNKLINSHWQKLVEQFVKKSIRLSRFISSFNGVRGDVITIDNEDGTSSVKLKAKYELPAFRIEFENYMKPSDEEKQSSLIDLYTAGALSTEQLVSSLHPK